MLALSNGLKWSRKAAGSHVAARVSVPVGSLMPPAPGPAAAAFMPRSAATDASHSYDKSPLYPLIRKAHFIINQKCFGEEERAWEPGGSVCS